MANSTKSDIRADIIAKARAEGFDAIGFTTAALPVAAREGLSAFLAAGHHGSMGWMEAHALRRGDPKALWPEVNSIIVLAANYGPKEDPRRAHSDSAGGVISVYARNEDYHDVLKKRLRRLAAWIAQEFAAEVKLFVDTAPVMEKPLAAAAGLGWQGKHTNLVSREYGSWLFLASIFTTLELEPDPPHTDHCGACTRCLTACPTAAFIGPHRIDARRCLSYLTIEHKTHIPAEFRAAMGNRIYGCDDCLAVCPWNKFAQASQEAAFQPRAELTAPRLAELAQLDDSGFRSLFHRSPIKRIGRDRFVRNVLIAIGNSGNPALARDAERLLADDSALVRAMAVWALIRLDGPRAQALRHSDPDPDVAAEWAVLDEAVVAR